MLWHVNGNINSNRWNLHGDDLTGCGVLEHLSEEKLVFMGKLDGVVGDGECIDKPKFILDVLSDEAISTPDKILIKAGVLKSSKKVKRLKSRLS